MKKFLKFVIALLVVVAVWGVVWLYKKYAPPPPEPIEIVLPKKPDSAEGNYDAIVLPGSA